MQDERHSGCRLVHAEADGLPGVVADRYGEVVVVQLSSAGAERWREAIVDALAAAPGVTCVFERSDADVRKLEGLEPTVGVLRGELPAPVVFREDGLAYRVDVVAGQKTGFYLDQRDNRRAVRALAARPRDAQRVLLHRRLHAGRAGRRRDPRHLDRQLGADALAEARANLAANPALDGERCEWLEADAFATLRKFRDAARSFDLIVLDPPKFAPTAAHAERASRAYKDVNLLGAEAAAPRRAAGDVLVLGRRRRRALPQDRRRRGARRRRRRGDRRPLRRRAPTIRSRWRFPRATTSRACSSARRRSAPVGLPRSRCPVAASAAIRARFGGRTKQGRSRLPGAALSASVGWTGGHPTVFGLNP